MTPAELERHACVIYAPQGAPRVWAFTGRFGPSAYQPKGAFRTNDAEQIRAAVLADLGLAHTPGWRFAAEIASGAVRPVLTAFEPPMRSISAVRPGGRFLASKVKVFIDFLAEIFAEEPSLGLSQPPLWPSPSPAILSDASEHDHNGCKHAGVRVIPVFRPS